MQDLGIALQTAHSESDDICNGVRTVPSNDWLMKRNCSLSPRQVGWFYLSIVCLSLAIAMFFAWRLSWLVLPFAGLDVLALGIALLVHGRHASDYERVTLAEGMLVVERSRGGQLTRQEFNALWVRMEVGESYPALIMLRSGKRVVQVGGFLDPHKRRQFARELAVALRCLR